MTAESMFSGLITAYRANRAHLRFLLAREVYDLYQIYPAKMGAIRPWIRWYPRGKGWTNEIEPGPWRLDLSYEWVPGDGRGEDAQPSLFCQLHSFAWHFCTFRQRNGRREVKKGEQYLAPLLLPGPLAKRSLRFKDPERVDDIVDWSDPAKALRYNGMVEDYQRRFTYINEIFRQYTKLREAMFTACAGFVECDVALAELYELLPKTRPRTTTCVMPTHSFVMPHIDRFPARKAKSVSAPRAPRAGGPAAASEEPGDTDDEEASDNPFALID